MSLKETRRNRQTQNLGQRHKCPAQFSTFPTHGHGNVKLNVMDMELSFIPMPLSRMKILLANFRSVFLCFSKPTPNLARCFCASTSPSPSPNPNPNPNIKDEGEEETPKRKKKTSAAKIKQLLVSSKVSDAAQIKLNWLSSLNNNNNNNSYHPSPSDEDSHPIPIAPQWVIGIDPDVYGALALLKPLDSGFVPQVFDSPQLKVLIGKRIRLRLDPKAIIQLLQSFDAPNGTIAYLEQSRPYPSDGKLGWWCGGFNYGIWIGALVGLGFSVVPVPSLRWKKQFKLAGNGSSKDDSREAARTLFPSMSSQLLRKKDHGRAEALLIAAYGKGLNLSYKSSLVSEELMPSNMDS